MAAHRGRRLPSRAAGHVSSDRDDRQQQRDAERKGDEATSAHAGSVASRRVRAPSGDSAKLDSPCPKRPSSTSTSTPSTRSSTAPAGSRTSRSAPPSSRCRRSSLTDHGSLAGAVELFKAARDEGVKPVLGCEVYVTDDRHAQQKGYAHLTLLAETNEGYANLIKLSSLGYLEGYYYKPRVDWELLERHGAGLIALSGCLSGRVCKALEENRRTDAEAELDRLEQVFGRDNVYVELQNAHLEVQQRITPQLVELAAQRGLPIVATGDVHYLRARGRAVARGAALHPVRRLAQEPEPLAVRDRPVLLQDAGGDGRRLPRPRGRDAADARGGRALQRRDRARPDPAPALPDARRPRRLRVPRRALREGRREALRDGRRRSSASASSSS